MAASKQNRFIITFFYVGVFFVSTDFSQAKSPACENWKFQCKDIQGFGAAKMTRIIIKRITSAKEWDHYWQVKLKITGKVKIDFLGCDFIA
jgi:hypothetical protein